MIWILNHELKVKWYATNGEIFVTFFEEGNSSAKVTYYLSFHIINGRNITVYESKNNLTWSIIVYLLIMWYYIIIEEMHIQVISS